MTPGGGVRRYTWRTDCAEIIPVAVHAGCGRDKRAWLPGSAPRDAPVSAGYPGAVVLTPGPARSRGRPVRSRGRSLRWPGRLSDRDLARPAARRLAAGRLAGPRPGRCRRDAAGLRLSGRQADRLAVVHDLERLAVGQRVPGRRRG